MNNKKIKIYFFVSTIICLLLIGIAIQEKSSFSIQEDRPLPSSDWKPETTLDLGGYPHTVSIGDVNNDGFNDIVTADFWSDYYLSIILWNDTSNDWDQFFPKYVGPHPESATIGDVDNDGFNDIISTNLNNDELVILPWNDTISDWNPAIKFTISGYIPRATIGDVDNDGFNDIAVINRNTVSIVVLLWNNSVNYWETPFNLGVGESPKDIAIGDVNNDGMNDLIAPNSVGDTISIYIWNNSSGYWNSEITESAESGQENIFIEDANNDGFYDIITTSKSTWDTVCILTWNDAISDWNPKISKLVGSRPSDVFVGDVDNDNYNDIVAANYNDDNLSIYIWNQTISGWNQEIRKDVGGEPIDLFIGDANNDGKNDIVAANRVDQTVSILISRLSTPYLNEINPNPSNNGDVTLGWNNISGAINYYIYRENASITSIDSLIPIDMVSVNRFEDEISIDGKYFYVVVAGDGIENSTISNCQSVVVILGGPPLVDGYSLFILIGIGCMVSFVIFRKKYKSL